MTVKRKEVHRYDRGELASPVKQANGWMRADGYIARTGVQVYRRADGSPFREYRPPEEVFAADAIASFELVPLTNDHPSEMLDGSNTKEYQVGTVASPRRDGERMRSSILVTDAETIAQMEAGKSELSCGYVCDLEECEGLAPDGQHYDAIQRNIRGNHVAVVTSGRAGPEVRVRMDSQDPIMVAFEQEPILKKSAPEKTVKIKFDGIEFDIADSAAQAAEKALKAHADAAAAAKAIADAATAKADTAIESLKKAQGELATHQAREAAKAKASLVASARKILGEEAKVDGLSELEIKRKVAETVTGLKMDDKSEAYVTAAFDFALTQHTDSAAKADSDEEDTAPIERVDAGDSLDHAESEARKRIQNAYRME